MKRGSVREFFARVPPLVKVGACCGVVAGAKVSLIDQGTNAIRASLTNESGEYVFNGVVPATYVVSAEAPSFKKFERKGVALGTQQFLTIDMKLEVGQVTESVMVTEEVPVIETASEMPYRARMTSRDFPGFIVPPPGRTAW